MLHQIGAGTLGPVFRAYQPDPGRLVAVKLFRLDVPPDSVHRFLAALNRLIAADLTNMGIAAPLEAGLSDGSAYLAMDFVAAESFDVVIRDYGPAPVAEALRIATQLGGALDFAAAVNVFHGTLHPRDVLVSADDTRVTGLGIAQALEQAGIIPPVRRPYTAPERVAGEAWDRRADVFSLAALMYEMLCGRRIAGAGAEAAAAVPALPDADVDALRAVFARALADDPADRFETALAFVEALHGTFGQMSARPARKPAQRRKREATTNGRRSRKAAPGALPLVEDDDGNSPTESVDEPALQRPESEQVVAVEPELSPIEPLDAVASPGEAVEDAPPAAASIASSRVMELDEPSAIPDLALRAAAEDRYEQAESAPVPAAAISGTAGTPIDPPTARPEPAPAASTTPPADRPVRPPRRSPVVRHEPVVDVAARTGTVFAAAASAEPERHRSGIWPIALALLVGLLVGFAFGFGAGSRERGGGEVATAAVPAAPPAGQAPAADGSPMRADGPGPRAVTPDPPVRAPAPPPAPVERRPPARAPSAERGRPPDTASRTPEPSPGRVLVRSSPAGARITVDGRDAGVAPVTVRDLAPGTHVVRIAQEGFVTVERRVRISGDQPAQSIEVDLVAARAGREAAPPAASDSTTGSLMVDSRPAGARVFVDGKLMGTTPMLIDAVGTGDHAVRLELEGFDPWNTTVRVSPGARGRVSGSLEQR